MRVVQWMRSLIVVVGLLAIAFGVTGSGCPDDDDDDESSSGDNCDVDDMCANFFVECGWGQFDISTPGSCEAGLADRCDHQENTDAYFACLCECRNRHPDAAETWCGCESDCLEDICLDIDEPWFDDDADDDSDDDDSDDDTIDDDAVDDDTGDSTWQEPPSNNDMDWDGAVSYCDGLDLDGHGDWRLPTVSELRSLVRGCEASEVGGECGVTDDCAEFACQDASCGGCTYEGGPGEQGWYWPDEMTGVWSWYWSATEVTDGTGSAWAVDYSYAGFAPFNVISTSTATARCIRP